MREIEWEGSGGVSLRQEAHHELDRETKDRFKGALPLQQVGLHLSWKQQEERKRKDVGRSGENKKKKGKQGGWSYGHR